MGELAVGIRTFWLDRQDPQAPVLRFGTGAGITWGSDPDREWAETELKAARLVAIASGSDTGRGSETGEGTDTGRGTHTGSDTDTGSAAETATDHEPHRA